MESSTSPTILDGSGWPDASEVFDVVVIGGGPAGVTAALRARELGARVALVERESVMGGTCTNDGCVPTRVLAHTARLVKDSRQFPQYGLEGGVPSVDIAALMERVRTVVAGVHDKKRLRDQLRSSGAAVFEGAGEGRFADANTFVLEGGTEVRGEKFVICAGGHSRKLPFPGAEYTITHDDVWSMTSLPASVVVVGASSTGCQLASVFAAFGSRTTLLDVAPRILANEDEMVSDEVFDAFSRRGMEIVTGTAGVTKVEKSDDGLSVFYKSEGAERHLDAGVVIVCAGWPGNVEGLGLDAAGVEASGGYIGVDDLLTTSRPNIFAAGDINGKNMLVQSATYEGTRAAENALLDSDRIPAHDVVPHGGFTDPEYGGVGMTEAQAQQNRECVVAVVPYSSLDRGVIDGYTDGACKLIVDRSTRLILGAHIVGEQAVEIVQIAATAMRAGMPVEELADLELAYPTFTAVVGIAAREVMRELDMVTILPKQGVERPRAAEWEYRAD